MQYLILVNNNNYFFVSQGKKYIIHNIFSSNNKLHRILRKVWLKYNFPFKRILFKEWINKVKTVDTIIIFDSGNASYIIKYLYKKYPQKRIIFWYWNPIDRTIPVEKINREKCEVWSFDPKDCRKYNLKYNEQFYFSENTNRIDTKINSQCSDVLFIGTDKNREVLLNRIGKKLDEIGVSYTFYLVKSLEEKENSENITYQKMLSYPEVLSYINKTKVIIDIAKGQSGMTLRPLESLFLKKKLITNQSEILKEDFYNPNNIFIWGYDNENRLSSFISSRYDDSNGEQFRNKYDFDAWIDRFEKQ